MRDLNIISDQSSTAVASPQVRPGRCRPVARRGITLIELMVSLVIGATLMGACGNAFLGGLSGYSDNMVRGQMLNMGRNGLDNIAKDIRMSDVHEPYDPATAVRTNETTQFYSGVVPGSGTPGLASAGGSGVIGIRMLKKHADYQDPTASTANPVTIIYWLDSANRQILCTRQAGAGPVVQTTVCTGVQNFRVFMQPIYIPYDPVTGLAGAWGLQRAVMQTSLANQGPTGQPVFTGDREIAMNLTNAAAPRRSFMSK